MVKGRQYRIARKEPDDDSRRWMAPITTAAARKMLIRS
jgi:hypothetical protein